MCSFGSSGFIPHEAPESRSTVGQSQDEDGAVTIQRDEIATVRTEGDLLHVPSGRANCDAFPWRASIACLRIPQVYFAFHAGSRQAPTVRTKRHIVLACRQHQPFLSGRRVPDSSRSIKTPCGNEPTIGAKGHLVSRVFMNRSLELEWLAP